MYLQGQLDYYYDENEAKELEDFEKFLEPNIDILSKVTNVHCYDEMINKVEELISSSSNLELAGHILGAMGKDVCEYYDYEFGAGMSDTPSALRTPQDIYDIYPDLQLDIDLANEGECR